MNLPPRFSPLPSVLRYLPPLLLAPLLSWAGIPAFAAEVYHLNPGDTIDITVWQEENLHTEAVVLPDGSVSFPLVGHVPAAGKTTGEFAALVKTRLAEFMPNPEVNVRLIGADGNMIYVTGEVAHPGAFVMKRPTDVMQAISMAGGLTAFAKRNDIVILHREADGHSSSLPFEYDEVEDGRELAMNILLHSGDTVVVP